MSDDNDNLSQSQSVFASVRRCLIHRNMEMDEDLLLKYLTETGGDADYLSAIPTGEIQLRRLMDIEDRIPTEGTFLVTSHYGTLGNAVAGDPIPKDEIIYQGVRIIHKGLEALKDEIGVYGQEVDKFSHQELNKHRRALAVMLYLANQALCVMEMKSVQCLTEGQQGMRKGLDGSGNATNVNWLKMRYMIIEDMLLLLDLPIEKIWDDPGYGYSVTRMFIRAMCNNMNEPSLAKDNMKMSDDPYKILSIMCKRFGKSSDVYQRLFPLIKYGEDVSKLVSRATNVMVNTYNIEDAVTNAFQTIVAVVEMDVCGSDKNASALAEKGVSHFLISICDFAPKDVIKYCGMYLVQMTKVDSASIRNATMEGAGNIIRYLHENERSTGISTEKLRKDIVEQMLVPHCRDSNALVRAKCLQTLAALVGDQCMEHLEVGTCMEAAIARIMDSAVLPRKYAISLINYILNVYPAICTSGLNFKEEVDKRRQKLLELLARSTLHKSRYIAALVREFTQQVQYHEIPLPEEQQPVIDEGMTKVRSMIAQFVQEEKFWEACLLLYHSFQTYGKESGLEDCGNAFAKPSLYISYFNNLMVGSQGSEETSERSALENSRDIALEEDEMESDEVKESRKLLKFAQGCLKMKSLLQPMIEKLTVLLQVGHPNDRTEVIKTIGELVRRGYPVGEKITTPVIQAIASLAEDLAGNLVQAFWDIFMGDRKLATAEVVTNLFRVMRSIDSCTRDLLRPIIGEMYVSGSLSKNAVNVLWDAFSKTYRWTMRDAKDAIFVLGAIGRYDKSVITSKITHIINAGLGEDALDDMGFVRATLDALLYSLKCSKKGESDIGTTHRFQKNHPIFERMVEIVGYGLTKKGNWDTHHHFPRVAELAIQIIYRLSWDHASCTDHLVQMVSAVAFHADPARESEIEKTEEFYIRFLAVMSALLGTHINYCETVVMPELKRRKLENRYTEVAEMLTKSGVITPAQAAQLNASRRSMVAEMSRSSKNGNSSIRGSARRKSRGGGKSKNRNKSTANAALAEMDALIGNVGFDNEVEVVKIYVEKLLDKGVFLQFRRLTLYFCQKMKSLKHEKLRLTVVNALTKLMLVSPDSVEKLIDVFVDLWHSIVDHRVKGEMLKQLTILNVRFPNQVERCNVIIKSGLKSDDTLMKIACLDFLGYLALGDIVKVRECISEVAMCLIDGTAKIRELSKDFFSVCGEKENVITNAVPEVISQLSKKEDLSQENFQKIMRYLLVGVKKEKQVMSLVDTLVTRLKGPSDNERLSGNTAYCLSELPHGEKSFKIISESLAAYADKLSNEVVFQSLIHIVENLRRNAQKVEFKAKLDDFERHLEELREKQVEKNRIAKAQVRHQDRRKRTSASRDASSLMEAGEAEVPPNNEIDVKQENPEPDEDQMQGSTESEDESS